MTVLRVVFGLLALAAMAWQLAIHLRLGYDALNFFSYFTNLSNLLAAVVLLLAALAGKRVGVAVMDVLRATAVINMALVGLVFGALLRDVDLGALRPWVNVVLHYVMPCVLVVDWLAQPPQFRLRARHLLLALAFPALYLVYTVWRGGNSGWYPYPFLNPAQAGGVTGVVAYALGIAGLFLATGAALLAIGNRRSGNDGAPPLRIH